MKIQVMSDIHLDFYNDLQFLQNEYFQVKSPCLILAGDIGSPLNPLFIDFFGYISKKWKTIIFVPGNHEYYSTPSFNINSINNLLKHILKQFKNVHLLNDDILFLEHILFIGSTLWSSPDYYEHKNANDFKNIYFEEKLITLNEMRHLNEQAICFIFKNIRKYEQMEKLKICVITHFMPLLNSDIPIEQRIYKYDSRYYGNVLGWILNDSDVWVCGHTHQEFDFKYKDKGKETRCICNAFGYPNEETTERKSKTFEL